MGSCCHSYYCSLRCKLVWKKKWGSEVFLHLNWQRDTLFLPPQGACSQTPHPSGMVRVCIVCISKHTPRNVGRQMHLTTQPKAALSLLPNPHIHWIAWCFCSGTYLNPAFLPLGLSGPAPKTLLQTRKVCRPLSRQSSSPWSGPIFVACCLTDSPRKTPPATCKLSRQVGLVYVSQISHLY